MDAQISYIPRQYVGEVSRSVKLKPTEAYDAVLNMDQIFSEPITMTGALLTLLSAGPDDKILILVNTPGGNMFALNGFLAGMRACKATTTTRVTGVAASCGFFLWINGEVLEMSKYALLMCHGASMSGMSGTTQDIHERAGLVTKQIRELCQLAVDKNILTDDELTQAIEQKCDVYLTHQDMVTRGVLK